METIYLFKKDNNEIYGYHIEQVEDSIPFQVKSLKEWEDFYEVNMGKIKLVNGKIEIFEVVNNEPLAEELVAIYDWFLATDYIPNKIVTGEWSQNDKRWTDYLKERTIKRARQDELLQLLQG